MSATSSVYSEFVDSRSPSPLLSDLGLYVGDSDDMDTDVTSVASRTPSVSSYDPSRDAWELLKEENGRIFNTKNDIYYLPAGKLRSMREGLVC